ncbi:MAG: FAD/NAD(P)-binding oxidoreductase [Saprospiraceae bacterium]
MHVVILGNGISGVTAARFIRKLSDHRITVISSESRYFYSRTALMYIYMGQMRLEDTQPYADDFWEKNRIDLLFDHVTSINFIQKSIQFLSKNEISYDKLILAVGSAINTFNWPGQSLNGVSGMYSLQDLQRIDQASNRLDRAVIVGGGLIGIELAEMLSSRNIPVTFLVREKSFWDIVLPEEESRMINQHLIEHGIDLRLETELRSIEDDGQGNVAAVHTSQNERIPCGFVGLTAGVHPNVDWLRDTQLEIQRGILVDEHLRTNLEDVYAIGDCAELRRTDPGRRSIEPVWYTGRMMGEVAAHNVCGAQVSYHPGYWFNSAKFLDIEYQVYGDIPPIIPPELETVCWIHSAGNKSIRLVWRKSDHVLTGVNLLGVRYRQEVVMHWLEHQSTIQQVMSLLDLANFDPEFYPRYEDGVRQLYAVKSGQVIKSASRRSSDAVWHFLKSSENA